MIKLMRETGLYSLLPSFAQEHPVYGTCAGLILLSSEVINHPVETLGLLDVTIQRNAYGRQINSFADAVDLNLDGKLEKVEGVFIRAPKIVKIGERITALAHHKEDVVMVESDHILASTFHPELSDNTRIHQYFLSKVKQSQ